MGVEMKLGKKWFFFPWTITIRVAELCPKEYIRTGVFDDATRCPYLHEVSHALQFPIILKQKNIVAVLDFSKLDNVMVFFCSEKMELHFFPTST